MTGGPGAGVAPKMPLSREALGVALVSAAAVAWSLTGLFVRAIDLPSATILVWRGLFGFLVMLPVIGLLKGRAGYAEVLRLGRNGWLYVMISGATMLCFITAMNLTTVAHVAVIYATIPFLAAGIGWVVLRERPGRTALIASSAALLGACLMAGWSRDGTLTGDLLAVAMTVLMACLIVLARADPKIPTMVAGTLSSLVGAAAALPFAADLSVTGNQMLLLALFGASNTAFAFVLFLLGSAMIPPVKSALISVLDTPLGPIWVWLVFAETPSPATIAGGAIVMASAVWYIRRDAGVR